MFRFLPAVFALLVMCRFVNAEAPVVELTLDATPHEQGIRLHREGVSAGEIQVDNKPTGAWVSRHNSVPADEWARSFLLTVTDPRFKNGKMPAVDIEVTYIHAANTKVDVVADTSTGSRVIGSGWGNKPELQTLRIRLDDAYFGARNHNNDPKSLPSDGFDLRVNAAAGDFYLRSVKIIGVDRKKVEDWSRFISVEQVADAKGFIVEPGGETAINFTVRNRALVDADAIAQWQVVSGDGKVLENREQKLTLAADSPSTLTQPFTTRDREVGEYAIRLTVLVVIDAKPFPVLQRAQPVAIAGPEDLFIIFDEQPIARGMEFDRTAVSPQQITIGGSTQWAWRAGFGSQRGGEGWIKSFLINITDERFINGGRPAVDVIVNYRHVANAPVDVYADTASGSRRVAEGWGRNENWQNMRARIDDALFNDTVYGSDPKAHKTDGFDLRVNFNTGDGELRSIFVRGYPLDQPDFTRLLRFDAVDAGRQLFIFEPGEKSELKLKLTNLATKPLDATYTVKLVDDFGSPVWSHEHQTTITPTSAFDVPVPFDTTGLKQGVYTIQLSLGQTTAAGYTPLIQRDVNVMVSEKSPIAKAKEGEFLYGLDMGVESFDDRWLQWADFMGVDILRGPGHGHNHTDVDALARAFDAIAKYNLRSSQFFDIPWHEDAAQRQRLWEELAARAEEITKRFGDRVYFYELGNEPDLTFFYPGPIEEYAKGYELVSRAIKRGDPDSAVMNGGLCFAGEEGDRRARRFIEVVNMDTLDAWAFHAHGPGAQSERDAVNRLKNEAAKWGKDTRPLVETESGVSARTPAQIRVQARTAVQKMVYAQSANIPAFMWFRLFITGGDGDYTNLKNVNEPRPVVLSYRTMTRHLKGMKFARMIPLEASEQEAYLFAEPNGTRRALVWWTSGRAGSLATLSLGAPVKNLKRLDLFGNPIEIGGADAGIVSLPIENDPSFLLWDATNDAAQIAATPSALVAPVVTHVTPGGEDLMEVTVRNDTAAPIEARVIVRVGDHSETKPVVSEQKINVPARSSAPVQLKLQTAAAATEVEWPQRWVVYTGVPSDTDVKSFSAIPQEISLAGRTYTPQVARPVEGRIDLAKLAGGFAERAEAIAFAEIESPDDRTIRVGGAADWWMAWFVNGRPVYNTLDAGNSGAQSILTHTFDMPLKKGTNLIAVRVLSGSMGFSLTGGGPRELAAARSSGSELGHNLSVELAVGNSVVARQRVEVARRRVVPTLPGPIDSPIEKLIAAAPVGDFVEQNIVNEWSKQPDSSRWWQGASDLSGSVWLYADDTNLYLVAVVRDDTHRDGDNLEIKLAAPGRAPTTIDAKAAGAQVSRTEEGRGAGTTTYRLTVPRSQLGGGIGSINARVTDDDFGGLKQHANWYRWDASPEDWYSFYLK